MGRSSIAWAELALLALCACEQSSSTDLSRVQPAVVEPHAPAAATSAEPTTAHAAADEALPSGVTAPGATNAPLEPPQGESAPSRFSVASREERGQVSAQASAGRLVVEWPTSEPCAAAGPPATVDVDEAGHRITIRQRTLPAGHRCAGLPRAYKTTLSGLAGGVYELSAPGLAARAIRVPTSQRPSELRVHTAQVMTAQPVPDPLRPAARPAPPPAAAPPRAAPPYASGRQPADF
jgi:hypothetical protein